MRRALALGLLGLSFASFAAAADWPQFGGPTANCMTPETGINKAWNEKAPAQRWARPLDGQSYSGPSAANGVVYLIDHADQNDVVLALDLATGTEKWTYAFPDAGRKDQGGFARTTPVVDNGKVYVQGRLGFLGCLDAATGKLLWSKDLVKDFGGKPSTWLYASAPLIDGDRVVVTPFGAEGAVAVLKKDTGDLIWQGGGTARGSYVTPVVATLNGKKQYLVVTATSLIGVDPIDGKRLWENPVNSRMGIHAARPVVLDDKTIFYTSGYGYGCELLEVAGDKVTVKWHSQAIISRITTPILFDGRIYCTGEQNSLVCLNPADGTVLWSQPGFGWGGIMAADGTIIALDEKTGAAVQLALTDKGYQELGRFVPLGGESRTAPILADGNLIVRNKATLAVYPLK